MKQHRRPRVYQPVAWSERVFLEIDPGNVHMFRYLLEAYDNLGYMSVVDRWRAVLRVSYSPHQKHEFFETLESIRTMVSFCTLPSRDLSGLS